MKTVLNVKIDKDIKEEAYATAREMGLPLSIVVGNLLKRFIDAKELRFDAPLKPSKRLIKALKEGEKNLRDGKNLSPLFTDMKKMDRYLMNL